MDEAIRILKEKTLPEAEKECERIREVLVSSVMKNGGHLASNLGIVEISVAAARVFDFPNDRIVYDTGHQCYVHKIITGREKDFSALRTHGGISGFPKRSESEYDAFGTGHSDPEPPDGQRGKIIPFPMVG